MSTTHRFQHFDILKGIAILLVVIGHAFWFGQRKSAFLNPFYHMLVAVHMPLFVFISGYFASKPIDWSCVGLKEYWQKKAKQLLLPLLFIPLFYTLVYSESLGALVVNNGHGGYWFTLALFEIFVVAFAFRWLDRYLNKYNSPLVSLGYAGVTILIVMGLHLLLQYLSIYRANVHYLLSVLCLGLRCLGFTLTFC